MTEHWQRVVGYEELYAVSTTGRVVSLAKGLLLSARLHTKKHNGQSNYLTVELHKNNKRYRCNVHKLVLTAFRGPRLSGQECRHLDGNPLNNELSNLAWGTYEENRKDWHKHHKKIKLTPELVAYIRNSSKSLRALAAELGVAKTTVQHARGYWRHVDV